MPVAVEKALVRALVISYGVEGISTVCRKIEVGHKPCRCVGFLSLVHAPGKLYHVGLGVYFHSYVVRRQGCAAEESLVFGLEYARGVDEEVEQLVYLAVVFVGVCEVAACPVVVPV